MVAPRPSDNMQDIDSAELATLPPPQAQAQAPPYELRSLRFGLTQPPRNGTAELLNIHAPVNAQLSNPAPTIAVVSTPAPSSPSNPLELTAIDSPATLTSADSIPPLMWSDPENSDCEHPDTQ